MALYLMVDGTPWRVHPTNSRDDVTARMSGDARTTVAVVPQDMLEPVTLHVNPKAIGWWALVDLPSGDD
jgi:hypothetical protein